MKPRAAQISVDPSGLVVVTTTNVQAALAQLDAAVGGVSTYSDENARDAIGTALVAGSGISISVNDPSNTITIAATGSSGFNPNPADDPANWTLLGSYAQEFTATGSSLPSGWSWYNQGSGAYSELLGVGVLDHPGQSGDNVKGIVRAIPTESSWTAVFKVDVTSLDTNFVVCGPIIIDSAGSKSILFGYRNHDTSGGSAYETGVAINEWTNSTTYAGDLFTQASVMGVPRYFRVKKNSSTSWDFAFSHNGAAWRNVLSANNISTFLTPDKIGFGLLKTGTGQALASCHWFRVT